MHIPQPTAADIFFGLGQYVVSDLDLQTDGSLTLNKPQESLLDNYAEALEGDPDAFSNSFIRMTYFSAVTITTLGFGDIVPITDTSRSLVAIEAVLGVIQIGLFLNSLAAKYLGQRT